MTLNVVILAAGQGKRMKSTLPKVLHTIGDKSLLEHVIHTAFALQPAENPIVIYGYKGDIIKHQLAGLAIHWVEQITQLGTGHALQQALPHLTHSDQTLILYGDVPLISIETLKKFIQQTPKSSLGIITAIFPDPTGLGRIIRDNKNNVINIVEDKDANNAERNINEINSGIYLVPTLLLTKWLPQIQNNNQQQEFYLTDIIALAIKDNVAIHTLSPDSYQEVLGVNDKLQLAMLERFFQLQLAKQLMTQGVTLKDPSRFDQRGTLQVGQDVIIDVNVIFEGHVQIGDHCTIGANSIIRNTIIGNHVEIKPNSIIDGAEIANNCIIGPFTRLRPGTELANHTHIGNFVEIKNSFIDQETKVNHLTYIGDSELGKKVNIGAGTITCNYDGINKHKTVIGDNAFIGSNSSLVAPVTIGEGATVGAGSIITRAAPAHQLTLRRAEQRSIANWQRPKKKEKEL